MYHPLDVSVCICSFIIINLLEFTDFYVYKHFLTSTGLHVPYLFVIKWCEKAFSD